jgi:chemotaxis protein CheD
MGTGTLVTVDVADLKVSATPQATLVTYALGSCIAVMVYDPRRLVAGMIHFMLPQSDTSPEKARERPAMFADTGVPLLFHAMYAQGCQKADLVVKLAGGSASSTGKDVFEIGRRNHLMARKLLWKAGVPIAKEDVGGRGFRTARLEVGSGRVTIKTENDEREM